MVSNADLEGSLGFADVVRATSALGQVDDSHGRTSDSMSDTVGLSIRKSQFLGIGYKIANITFTALVSSSACGAR